MSTTIAEALTLRSSFIDAVQAALLSFFLTPLRTHNHRVEIFWYWHIEATFLNVVKPVILALPTLELLFLHRNDFVADINANHIHDAVPPCRGATQARKTNETAQGCTYPSCKKRLQQRKATPATFTPRFDVISENSVWYPCLGCNLFDRWFIFDDSIVARTAAWCRTACVQPSTRINTRKKRPPTIIYIVKGRFFAIFMDTKCPYAVSFEIRSRI